MPGASGYMLKQILGQHLVSAVRTVAAGRLTARPSQARSIHLLA